MKLTTHLKINFISKIIYQIYCIRFFLSVDLCFDVCIGKVSFLKNKNCLMIIIILSLAVYYCFSDQDFKVFCKNNTAVIFHDGGLHCF